MPRLKPSANEQKKRQFQAAIASGMVLYGFDYKFQVAEHIGVSRETLRRWLDNPDKIPVGDLKRLNKTLHLPDETILMLMK